MSKEEKNAVRAHRPRNRFMHGMARGMTIWFRVSLFLPFRHIDAVKDLRECPLYSRIFIFFRGCVNLLCILSFPPHSLVVKFDSALEGRKSVGDLHLFSHKREGRLFISLLDLRGEEVFLFAGTNYHNFSRGRKKLYFAHYCSFMHIFLYRLSTLTSSRQQSLNKIVEQASFTECAFPSVSAEHPGCPGLNSRRSAGGEGGKDGGEAPQGGRAGTNAHR